MKNSKADLGIAVGGLPPKQRRALRHTYARTYVFRIRERHGVNQMTVYGPTKEVVKEAFWKIVDKSDENDGGVNWVELSEPAFWRGTMPGHIRDAQGWLDPTPPGPTLPVRT